MTTFASSSKSNILLQSKRYTVSAPSQEAYARVLDLNASEIYIEEHALPTSSEGLPYSGSDGDGLFITSGSSNIAVYYYRLRLTPSNVTTNVGGVDKAQAWFAVSGSDGTGVTPQVIQSDQIPNWVSNKYITPGQASRTAENPNPNLVGYNVVISTGSSDTKEDAEPISANSYQFDYKTGVVQFVNEFVSPSAERYVFLSGYAYVGQTLDQYISSGPSGGGGIPGGDNTQIQFNNSDAFGGSPRLTFDSATGKTTVSGSLIVSGSDSSDVFLIKSGSIDIAKVDNNGNFVLVERTGDTPTPVAGGIMYSSSAFYVGIG